MSADCSVIADTILKSLALFGAVLAFAVGIWQYHRSQLWKRAEWVAQEMKELLSDPIVQAALLMIDWGKKRRIPLYPNLPEESNRYTLLDDDKIAQALRISADSNDNFGNDEADIRAAFDRLLDGIERFNAYVETGLISETDLNPYLGYWARKICDTATSPPQQRILNLHLYMEKYRYIGAFSLLKRLYASQTSIQQGVT